VIKDVLACQDPTISFAIAVALAALTGVVASLAAAGRGVRSVPTTERDLRGRERGE
jgi:hypothetical protein